MGKSARSSDGRSPPLAADLLHIDAMPNEANGSCVAAPISDWCLWLMLASGFAGLGYQIVWTQQLALWLGHESAAVLAVVAAFFGGLSLGALATGNSIERSSQPRFWYVGCETLIALWALLLIFGLPHYSARLLGWIGPEASALRQWAIAFCGVFALLLPATAAMGATLPAMERIAAGLNEQHRSISGFYAANTAGAVCGVLAAAFCLVPSFWPERHGGALRRPESVVRRCRAGLFSQGAASGTSR